jgi:hypothetical protein
MRVCKLRRFIKRVVPVVEEPHLPPRILLGAAPCVPYIGVHEEGRIGVEVRRQVLPLSPDLGGPLRLGMRHGRDQHPEVADLVICQPPPGRCTSPQRWHDIQFRYINHAMSTRSSTLFGRSSFFTPLPNASESCFFFLMVMRWRVVVRVGAEV